MKIRNLFCKAFIFIVLITELALSQKTINSQNFNFRKTKWGINKEQVKHSEKNILLGETEEYLFYKGTLANKDVLICYLFLDSKLVRGRYLFINKHDNDNEYMNDFFEIRESLMNKYTKVTMDSVFWNNMLYLVIPEKWGFAISIGHLVLISSWETEDTEISLVLTGVDGTIIHVLEYTGKKFKSLIEEEMKKEEETEF